MKSILSLVVEKDGRITQPLVVRSLDKAYDNEALRVVKSMPRWNRTRKSEIHNSCDLFLIP
jgi:hypothetical protein